MTLGSETAVGGSRSQVQKGKGGSSSLAHRSSRGGTVASWRPREQGRLGRNLQQAGP